MPRLFMALPLVFNVLVASIPALAADEPMSLHFPPREDLRRTDLGHIAASAAHVASLAGKMSEVIAQLPANEPCPFTVACEEALVNVIKPMAVKAFMLENRAREMDAAIDPFDLFAPVAPQIAELRTNHFDELAVLQYQLRTSIDPAQQVELQGYYEFKSTCEDLLSAYWILMKQLVAVRVPLGDVGGHNVD